MRREAGVCNDHRLTVHSVDSHLECKYAPAVLDYSDIICMYKYMTE